MKKYKFERKYIEKYKKGTKKDHLLVPIDHIGWFAKKSAKWRKIIDFESKNDEKQLVPLYEQLLSTSQELSAVEGFSSYEEKIAKRNMLNTPQKIQMFLEQLMAAVKPSVTTHNAQLLNFARNATKDNNLTLTAWDIEYYK